MTPLENVELLLSKIKIPKIRRKNVSGDTVRTVTLGQINRPFHKFKGYSKFTEKYPALWNAVKELAEYLNPNHRYTSVTINHNVLCKPHKDVRNDGTTLIIGLGNYEGGELVVNNEEIDIRHKPYYFNGYLNEHYNKPWTGERWSLMFYSLRKSWDIKHREEDIPIIKEVFHGNQYHRNDIGFGVEEGELWLDIGAHIGCFTKKCRYYGAQTISYEPDPDNFSYLLQNSEGECFNVAVGAEDDSVDLVKGSKCYFNKVKHGTQLTQVAFEKILREGCCVKMDIEGAEIEILDKCDFSGIKKLVFAYHIKTDPSRSNFLKRMDRLREWFDVYHQEIKTEHMDFFPNEIIVYAKGKK